MASMEEQVNNGRNYSSATSSIHNDQHSVTQFNGRPQEQQLPTAVEAVISFGYPLDLVLSVHRQLARAPRRLTHTEDTVAVPGSASAHVTGSSLTRDVSAPALLVAVEEAVSRSDVAGTGHDGVSFNFSSTEVSPAGRTSGGDRWTVLTQPHSSSGGQSSISQLSTIISSDQSANCTNGSSSTHRITIGNQSSSSEYPGRVTRSVEAFTSTPSSAQVRDGPDASSSPGVTAARNMAGSENWSSASEVAVTSTFTSPSNPNPPSAHVKTSTHPPHPTFPSASVEEDSDNVAPHHHGTQSTTANPNRESETRDRMERGADNAKATERRRRQLERLRALRAENRRLKARLSCLHCGQRPVALTFLPCGHFAYCQQCGTSFEACPLCHKTILADVRTFLS